MRLDRVEKIPVDNRGKITTGYKNQKGMPSKADHFVIVDPVTKESPFPELVAAYGEKPTEFIITFPSDDMNAVFDDNYNCWGKNKTKIRTCNGLQCTHIIPEQFDNNKYQAGEVSQCVCKLHNLSESDDPKIRAKSCRVDMYLKAYIFNPKSKQIIYPLPYLFASHSIHSANNIASMLSQVRNLRGMIFRLSLQQGKKGEQVYYIWNLLPAIMPKALLEMTIDEPLLLSGQEEVIEDVVFADYEYDDPGDDYDIQKIADHLDRIKQCMTMQEVDDMVNEYGKYMSVQDMEVVNQIAETHKELIKQKILREQDSPETNEKGDSNAQRLFD